jgi:hypothetical protein
MPLDTNARLRLAQTDPEAIAAIFNDAPVPEDSYLYDRFGGDFTKYEEMLLDPQVRGKLSERVGALLGRSVLIDAATRRKIDQDAADTARRIIDHNLIPYEQVCNSFLYSGLIFGFSVMAVAEVEEKQAFYVVTKDVDGEEQESVKNQTVVVPKLEFVPQRRFVFRNFEPENKTIPVCSDEDLDLSEIAKVNGYELRLLTKRSPINGERCPKNRFFTFTFGSIKGLPQGYGLGAQIRKFYEIRRECLRSGVLTADRLGSPPVHGTYPNTLDTKDSDQAEVLNAFDRVLRAFSPNGNALTSEGFTINFLEPSKSGGHEILKWLYETSGLEITRAIWGEGSYSEKGTGSYAAATQQAENRNENVVDSDCNSLDEQLADQLWQWIADRNYPKANPPKIRRETFAERRKIEQLQAEEELRNQRVQTDVVLINTIGLSVTQEYISEVYGDAFTLPAAEPAPTDTPQDVTTLSEPDWKLYFFEHRRTGIIARSVEEARAKLKRGGTKLVKVRALTEEERKIAERGDWVRSGPNGEHSGYNPNKRGFGPAPSKKGGK